MKFLRFISVFLVIFCITAVASAANILTQTPQGNYANNVLFGSQWTEFTAMMVAEHDIYEVPNFEDPSTFAGFDAIWVDQELSSRLTANEINNLRAYLEEGHKLVLIGENNSWYNWLHSIVAVVGGGFKSACSWAVGYPISSHQLTEGITSVQNICGSLVLGSQGDPDILFDNEMAAVYTIGAGEALVILDSNWNDDDWWAHDNRIFAANIVKWLGDPGILAVDIDIKPGDEPNCINNNGHGAIPVAIFGSENLDVNDIDAASLSLEGLSVKATGKKNRLLAHYEDTNGDGYVDLVVQFDDSDAVFAADASSAVLTGLLVDGTSIEGSDSICIVP